MAIARMRSGNDCLTYALPLLDGRQITSSDMFRHGWWPWHQSLEAPRLPAEILADQGDGIAVLQRTVECMRDAEDRIVHQHLDMLA